VIPTARTWPTSGVLSADSDGRTLIVELGNTALMDDSSAGPVEVLHVDDDPALGELVKLYLEREESDLNCDVTTETSPVAALDRIRADDAGFDCVISDYDMPEMNGIEFLERVRESRPELPVLLFSG
jgi:DNA-binding NtrC family response regulator